MKKVFSKQFAWRSLLKQTLRGALPLPWLFGALYALAFGWGYLKENTLLPAIYRDAALAKFAFEKAGPFIPFEEEEQGSYIFDPNDTWDIATNSQWLGYTTRQIVPFMSYESLTGRAIYPSYVLFFPYLDQRSLHVLGTAGFSPFLGPVVQINERFLSPPSNDMRELLPTLVHELIHIQGGNFLNGKSYELESATSAATIEVLAAMCNYQQPYACQAFWYEISGLARSSMKYNLNSVGAGWVYETYANLFLREYQDLSIAEKRNRFWSEDPEEYQDILHKYGYRPWAVHVLPGIITEGKKLDTGNKIFDAGEMKATVIGMPWDDTRDVLGSFWIFFLRLFT